LQGVRRQTRRSEGNNPIWNEQLSLPVQAHGDYTSVDSLSQIEDHVKVTIYDQCSIDVSEQRSDSAEEEEVTRFSNHYIGTAYVPFQTFYRHDFSGFLS
jgi:hypothetical protein